MWGIVGALQSILKAVLPMPNRIRRTDTKTLTKSIKNIKISQKYQ